MVFTTLLFSGGKQEVENESGNPTEQLEQFQQELQEVESKLKAVPQAKAKIKKLYDLGLSKKKIIEHILQEKRPIVVVPRYQLTDLAVSWPDESYIMRALAFYIRKKILSVR